MAGSYKIEISKLKWVKGKVLQMTLTMLAEVYINGKKKLYGTALKGCIITRDKFTGELHFKPPASTVHYRNYANILVTPDVANDVLALIEASKYASSIGTPINASGLLDDGILYPDIPEDEKFEIGGESEIPS